MGWDEMGFYQVGSSSRKRVPGWRAFKFVKAATPLKHCGSSNDGVKEKRTRAKILARATRVIMAELLCVRGILPLFPEGIAPTGTCQTAFRTDDVLSLAVLLVAFAPVLKTAREFVEGWPEAAVTAGISKR